MRACCLGTGLLSLLIVAPAGADGIAVKGNGRCQERNRVADKTGGQDRGTSLVRVGNVRNVRRRFT